MSTVSTRVPTFIAPERLYALKGFIAASGVSATRRREASQRGIVLLTIEVGRRKFVRGHDAIEYIEKLAQLPSHE